MIQNEFKIDFSNNLLIGIDVPNKDYSYDNCCQSNTDIRLQGLVIVLIRVTPTKVRVDNNFNWISMPLWFKLSRNSIVLALAEPVLWLALCTHFRALAANMFKGAKIVNKEYPEIFLNFAQGIIAAIMLSLFFYINWTTICIALMIVWYCFVMFTVIQGDHILSENSSFVTFVICASTALLPLRFSYILDQVPYDSSNAKSYFSVIVGSWRISELAFKFYLSEGNYVTAVRDVAVFISTALTLYLVLLFVLDAMSFKDPRLGEWNNFKRVFAGMNDLKVNENSSKLWAVFHIAMVLTSHTFAKYITRISMIEQVKSVAYYYGSTTELIMSCIEHVVGIIVLFLLEVVIRPLMAKWNREVTEFWLIGLAMVFGCLGLIVTSVIQSTLDTAIRAPRRQEGLVFLFNMLPDPSSFSSALFSNHLTRESEKQNNWMQVNGYEAVAWRVHDVVGRRQFPCAVVNLNQSTWEETHIEAVEGAILSYVVTRKALAEVFGLRLDNTIRNHTLLFVGCATEVCVGHIYFHATDGKIQILKIPHNQNLTSIVLRQGMYNITTFFMAEEEVQLISNVQMKSEEVKAAFIFEKQGDPDLQIFEIHNYRKIPDIMYALEMVLVGFRDIFFDVGIFWFLFHQTKPNSPSRPFIFSMFIFISVAIPWIFMAGLRIAIYTVLEANEVQIGVLWYGCCFFLYVHYANNFVQGAWEETE